jgi:hypothetical protein
VYCHYWLYIGVDVYVCVYTAMHSLCDGSFFGTRVGRCVFELPDFLYGGYI